MAQRKPPKKVIEKEAENPLNNALPQNIIPFGERVEEDKNIYIFQKVYKEIRCFTKDKTTNESGGMLFGTIIEEFGKTNIVINGFVEAKYSEGTPTTLKFTHETWEYVHKEASKKFPGQKIVGWIHTHPNFGIFLSEYDKFIQENFFNEDYQIAYVVDPIQNIEGFYFWINNKIERCKGFYVFDKNGTKITVNNEEKVDETDISSPEPLFSFRNALIGLMAILVIVLLFMNISLRNRIKNVERQQQALVESANSSIYWLQQQIAMLTSQVDEINAALAPDPSLEVSAEPDIPDEETDSKTIQGEIIAPDPAAAVADSIDSDMLPGGDNQSTEENELNGPTEVVAGYE